MSKAEATVPQDLPLVAAALVEEFQGAIPPTLPRHRHGLPRDAVRASQGMRILVATAQVVAEKGYGAASVAAIVERAGVSTKTFYELYADKEEAFLAAYAAVDIVIARMERAALEQEDPRDMIRAGIGSFLASLAEQPAFTRMLVIEATGAGPRVLKRRVEAFQDFVRVLGVPLRLAHAADPRVPAPDDTIVLAVLGGITELVLHHLVERDPATLPDLGPAALELIERACLNPTGRGS